MYTLPLSYFGPIEEYSFVAQNEVLQYEVHEHFVKQSYRNHCKIYGANGTLKLTVPLVLKSREKTPMKDVKIAKNEQWQAHHWKSIQSAYKNSPFFDYYHEQLLPIFLDEYHFLMDLDLRTNEIIQSCIGTNCQITKTNSFDSYSDNDLRLALHPKKAPIKNTPRYIQVFEEKHGFQPNLSILDLLFNEGPQAIFYLQNL